MEFKEAAEKINEKLSVYGEYISPDTLCFRAFLQGVLDRLVYDEGVMTPEEAQEIEALLDGVKDPFEEKYGLPGDGRW